MLAACRKNFSARGNKVALPAMGSPPETAVRSRSGLSTRCGGGVSRAPRESTKTFTTSSHAAAVAAPGKGA